ncbi:hypothetical protein [Halochromatium roseum]|uniref:hypothetical protein n=1 Tax=Halochromatium roseum TaxID=391920 RepID=UPI0019132215|nr:hypothetical protein [Halochromatium roseum]MBK5939811.1 hypothetical protein [Halochromatium roseum]
MPSAADIQSEIDRRAKHLCQQRVLAVDYYRIRKRLAVPLPVHAPLTACYPVRNFSARYTWTIWLLWALEDRIETLGAAVTFLDSAAARTAVVADLAALAAWPGAFYLMVAGKKAVVHWYTPSPEVALPIPEAAGHESLEVRGFVREQAQPDKKRMLAVAVA